MPLSYVDVASLVPAPSHKSPSQRSSKTTRTTSRLLDIFRPKPASPLDPIPIPGLEGIMSNDGVAKVFDLDPRTKKDRSKTAPRGIGIPTATDALVKAKNWAQKKKDRDRELELFFNLPSQESNAPPTGGDRRVSVDDQLPKHSNIFTGIPTPSANNTANNSAYPSKTSSPNPTQALRSRKNTPSVKFSGEGQPSLRDAYSTPPAKPRRKMPARVTHGELMKMPSVDEPMPDVYPGATAEQIEAYERAATAAREAHPHEFASHSPVAENIPGSFLDDDGRWRRQLQQQENTPLTSTSMYRQQAQIHDRRQPEHAQYASQNRHIPRPQAPRNDAGIEVDRRISIPSTSHRKTQQTPVQGTRRISTSTSRLPPVGEGKVAAGAKASTAAAVAADLGLRVTTDLPANFRHARCEELPETPLTSTNWQQTRNTNDQIDRHPLPSLPEDDREEPFGVSVTPGTVYASAGNGTLPPTPPRSTDSGKESLERMKVLDDLIADYDYDSDPLPGALFPESRGLREPHPTPNPNAVTTRIRKTFGNGGSGLVEAFEDLFRRAPEETWVDFLLRIWYIALVTWGFFVLARLVERLFGLLEIVVVEPVRILLVGLGRIVGA